MGVLNRARKGIYRNVWIHYFVFKDNDRTKKRVGHSYRNLRVFLIPFDYWWRDAYSSEDRRRNVEFGSTTYSDTLWWQEKCALRCPGTVYLLSLPSLTATQGFQFFEWKAVQYLIIFSRNSYKGEDTRLPVSWGAHRLSALITRSYTQP